MPMSRDTQLLRRLAASGSESDSEASDDSSSNSSDNSSAGDSVSSVSLSSLSRFEDDSVDDATFPVAPSQRSSVSVAEHHSSSNGIDSIDPRRSSIVTDRPASVADSDARVPLSRPASGVRSYVSVILHLELQDVPALGIRPSARASVTWTCVESSDVGRLPTFLLEVADGLEIEYAPATGVIAGKAADGAALRYEFGPRSSTRMPAPGALESRHSRSHAPTISPIADSLRVLVRFCQCLALRTMQLRKQALALETNKLPMVHYDALPESLLASFRPSASMSDALRQSLRVDDTRSVCGDSDRLDHVRTVEIAGVGRGYLSRTGDLRIVFLDASELSLDADGSHLRFQYARASSVDVFPLLTTSASASAFLPTVVKKRLESVPDFIRRLRGGDSARSG